MIFTPGTFRFRRGSNPRAYRRSYSTHTNMTTPKTEPKIRKHAHHANSYSDSPEAASDAQTMQSTTMIEACDRLGQKLDEVTAIIREQALAWQQIREPIGANSSGDEIPGRPNVNDRPMESHPLAAKSSNGPEPERLEIGAAQNAEPPADLTGAPSATGAATMAEQARRLVDTLSTSRDGWQEQAADLQQALESIMDFLERQNAAAAAAPKVDIADIISRLRNLEEEQQNLRSQISINRWGPS
jgi:hypothetical protein